jgi:DinB superfamily
VSVERRIAPVIDEFAAVMIDRRDVGEATRMRLKDLGRELIRTSDDALNVTLDVEEEGLRWRPASGEWSAIEIVGHLIDKMQIWHSRVLAMANANTPTFEVFDQDELVDRRQYISASVDDLRPRLKDAASSFADTLGKLPESAAARLGRHPEYGLLTLRRCVEIPLEAAREHISQLETTLTRAASSSSTG